MRLDKIAMIGLSCLLLVGCSETMQEGPDKGRINAELVTSLHDIQGENAVIHQHVLFPYHFIDNGAELNELGQRDMAILAERFGEHPGLLTLSQSDTPSSLYAARVHMIVNKLREAGIDTERIRVSDGMPGGPGMASDRVLTILENESQTAVTMRSSSTEIRP
jgi:hypothetical protein